MELPVLLSCLIPLPSKGCHILLDGGIYRLDELGWHDKLAFDSIAVLIKGCDLPCHCVECPEGIGIQRDEVIAEPSALCEVVPELFLFCLVQAFQVELQLNAERAHRGMAETGFLSLLLYHIVLHDALRFTHNSLYHIGLISSRSHAHQAIHLHPAEDGVFLPISG